MRVVFVSNYLTHHQLPLCREMNKRLRKDFCFIETEQMEQERVDLGWRLEENNDINIMKSYVDDKAYQESCRKIVEADVAIIGGTRDEYIVERLKVNKLIFRYEERFLKKSWLKLLDPRVLHMIYVTHLKNQKKKVYILCAGAYLRQELKLFHLYKNKMFKWGYFPETCYYDVAELMWRKENKTTEILWCARFIWWKHPEKVINAAEWLVKQGMKFHITMIGNGELLTTIEKKVIQKKLDIYISFLGAVPSAEVRGYMEKADIFLATSDRNEGWGAVINEAMNSGCAVVADRMMGSVPYLIKNGENGYAYKNDKECFSYLKFLVENENERKRLGINAYKTIAKNWNAEKAAENLFEVMNGLLEEEYGNIPLCGPGSAEL